MAHSAMDQFTAIIVDMLKSPPDPNAPLPLVNRQGTAYGVTIPFHVSIDNTPDKCAFRDTYANRCYVGSQ